MQRLWMDMLDLIEGDNRHAIGLTFSSSTGETWQRCLLCGATFPQSDEGFADMERHDFDAHEKPVHYDYHDLHGMEVTIAVVEREEEDSITRHLYGRKSRQIELLARGKDGTIYSLPFSFYDAEEEGSFKWKPQPGSPASNLLRLTQPAAEPPSSD